MKTVIRTALLLSICTSFACAQQPSPPELTEHHKNLQKETGVWDGEMKMWMAPGMDPQTMPIVETNTMMEGGLWLISEFDGGPFKGRGQFGYDTISEKCVGTWIDNMSTSQSVMTGNVNDQGELEMHFTGYNHETKSPEKMKSISKMTGEDTREFTMYRQGDGDEWVKMFEIMYKRRG